MHAHQWRPYGPADRQHIADVRREAREAEASGDDGYAAERRRDLRNPEYRRLNIECGYAAEHHGHPFRILTPAERAEAHRPRPAVTTATGNVTRPRSRGAGRPRAAASRSSARSGDSGDDGEPGEPSATRPVWRFGVGQTHKEERAEIARAQIEGRGEEYAAAQAEARQRGEGLPNKLTPWERRRAAEQAEPGQKSHAGVLGKFAEADATPARTPTPSRARATPLGPSTSTCMHGDPASEGNALLRDNAAGAIEPVHVAVPTDLPPTVAKVAQFIALFTGCRLSVGDDRPVPLAQKWVGAHVGIDGATASRALGALVRRGFLADAGSLPALNGKPNGTKLYAVVGHTATDDDPTASGESVHVPAQGHRPSAALLLHRALELPESERKAAWWLAQQLYNNGHDEHTTAHNAMCDYAAARGLTLSDALRTLHYAYGRPAREPWGPPGTSDRAPQTEPEPSPVPVEAQHVGAPGAAVERHREAADQSSVVHAVVGRRGLPSAVAVGHGAGLIGAGVEPEAEWSSRFGHGSASYAERETEAVR